MDGWGSIGTNGALLIGVIVAGAVAAGAGVAGTVAAGTAVAGGAIVVGDSSVDGELMGPVAGINR